MRTSPFILLKLEYRGKPVHVCFTVWPDRVGVQIGERRDAQFVGQIYFELPFDRVPRLRELHDGVAWNYALLEEIVEGVRIEDSALPSVQDTEKVVDMQLCRELDDLVNRGLVMKVNGRYQLTTQRRNN